MAKERPQIPGLKITVINNKYYIFALKGQPSEFLDEVKVLIRKLSERVMIEETLEGSVYEEERLWREKPLEDDFRRAFPDDQILLGLCLFEAFNIMQWALYNKLRINRLTN